MIPRTIRFTLDLRRLFPEGLAALHHAGKRACFGDLAGLADAGAFAAWLAPFRKMDWVVIVPEARLRHDARPPFGGPEAMLANLGRYTDPLPGSGLPANRERGVAISNSRLVSADSTAVAFRWKD